MLSDLAFLSLVGVSEISLDVFSRRHVKECLGGTQMGNGPNIHRMKMVKSIRVLSQNEILCSKDNK